MTRALLAAFSTGSNAVPLPPSAGNSIAKYPLRTLVPALPEAPGNPVVASAVESAEATSGHFQGVNRPDPFLVAVPPPPACRCLPNLWVSDSKIRGPRPPGHGPVVTPRAPNNRRCGAASGRMQTVGSHEADRVRVLPDAALLRCLGHRNNRRCGAASGRMQTVGSREADRVRVLPDAALFRCLRPRTTVGAELHPEGCRRSAHTRRTGSASSRTRLCFGASGNETTVRCGAASGRMQTVGSHEADRVRVLPDAALFRCLGQQTTIGCGAASGRMQTVRAHEADRVRVLPDAALFRCLGQRNNRQVRSCIRKDADGRRRVSPRSSVSCPASG
jgi:hypothetical protein